MRHLLDAFAVATFWVSVGWILYTYVGYPLLLRLWAVFTLRPVKAADYEPYVSLIIAVHNEERTIARKLENILSLDYPKEKLQVLVVSDSSADSTNEIVSSFAARGVSLIKSEERGGKHRAQRRGIDHATGHILVLTDAAPLIERHALRNMMRNFADPSVGCAGGEDRVFGEGSFESSEGAYISYDMSLRRLESMIGSSVGLSGAFFAVRPELCEPWDNERSSDFHLALEAVRRGLRSVSDSSAVHHYTATRSHAVEFTRKTRTMLNGLVVFSRSRDLLNPFRYGFFAVQLLSHKFCRWCVPFALLAMLIASSYLSMSSPSWRVAAGAQICFYLIALAGLRFPPLCSYSPIRTAAFFTLSNAAILVAWLRFCKGGKFEVWQPTRRS
jgi:cellulose synthase/poly-beta-1,6-N-acetylglucosamine synthase-like glycosyltransferase